MEDESIDEENQTRIQEQCNKRREQKIFISEQADVQNITAQNKSKKKRYSNLTPEKRRKICDGQRIRRIQKRRKERELIEKARNEGIDAAGISVEMLEELESKFKERRKRMAEYARKRRQMQKQDPEKQEELLKRQRFQRMVKKATMTDEELEEHRRKLYLYKQAYYARNGRWCDQPQELKSENARRNLEWRNKLEGAKKERYYESVKKAMRKHFEKVKTEQPDKWEKHKKKMNAYQRNRYANETPGQRERRRYKDKVCGAKRKMKKKWEDEGVEEEEIERRLEELAINLWKEFDPNIRVPPSRGKKKRSKEEIAGTPSSKKRSISNLVILSSSHEIVIAKVNCESRTGNLDTEEMALNHRANEEAVEEKSELFGGGSSPPSPQTPSPPAAPNKPLSSSSESAPTNTNEDHTSRVMCSHCSLTFSEDKQLRDHIRSLHSESCWTCPKCDEVMLSPQDLIQHFQSVHKQVQTEMAASQVQLPVTPAHVKVELDKQELEAQGKIGGRFICMCCPPPHKQEDFFQTRLDLFAHVKSKHKKHFWPCEQCNLLKYSKEDLEFHRTICGSASGKKKIGAS